ncbi:MAG: chemotaxis protein, partial [Cronobacter sakazakii]|nr:chemotaxis protein [Cronobacter sakazakii]
ASAPRSVQTAAPVSASLTPVAASEPAVASQDNWETF